MENIETLKRVPLFKDLTDTDLMSIQEATTTRRLHTGEILFYEGDKGDTLYAILEGKIKVTILAEDGREVIISMLDKGEIFGEMALFDLEEKRSATAMATEPTTLLSLMGKDFLKVLEGNSQLTMRILRTMTGRLKNATRRISSLILLDTYARITRYLLDLAEEKGRLLLDGSVMVEKPPHHVIAGTLGTSRETVCRTLKELEAQGILTMSAHDIIIHHYKAAKKKQKRI